MGNVTARITTDKQVPGFWRVKLNHPPINTIDDQMYDEIFDLVEAIVAEPSLKVVTFEERECGLLPRSLWRRGIGKPLRQAALDRGGNEARPQQRAQYRCHPRPGTGGRRRVRFGLRPAVR